MNGPEWMNGQTSGFRCPACGQPYGSTQVRLLAERDGLFFVDLDCRACDSRTVAIVTVELDDAEAQMADIGAAMPALPLENHAQDAAPVTADDVLEMHEFLAIFEGDVTNLFRAAARPVSRGAERG